MRRKSSSNSPFNKYFRSFAKAASYFALFNNSVASAKERYSLYFNGELMYFSKEAKEITAPYDGLVYIKDGYIVFDDQRGNTSEMLIGDYEYYNKHGNITSGDEVKKGQVIISRLPGDLSRVSIIADEHSEEPFRLSELNNH